MIDMTKHLPASLDAIRQEAVAMLGELERHRARLFVQQITNKHSDEDICEVRQEEAGPRSITYAERTEELDAFEANLRAGLPPTVLDSISTNGASA